MTEKRKSPVLRFRGYTDDWEQRKFSDVVATRRGLTYKPSDIRKNGVRVLRSSNIAEDSFTLSDEDVFVAREAINIDCARANDILITAANGSSRLVGKHTIISGIPEGSAVHGGFMLLGTTKEPHFVNASMGSSWYRRFIELFVAGGNGAIGNLNKNDLDNQEIAIPSEEEKKKIGSFFQQLDSLITLHQRKLEKLKLVKKSMLEKMFPKNGSSVPEIRFNGFTDDWEQRKLGELIIEYKETVDSSCTLPVLTSSKTEGIILQEEHFGRKQQHDITGYNVLPRNYCTYRNRSDGVDFTFNVNECCDMGIISKFYPVFCGVDNDTYLLSLVLNNSDEVVHEIAYTCTGTGQKVLSFLDLQKMTIRVPRHSEQKKISAYFKQLDNLITLHQRKVEKLQIMKKSMLEKMFV